MTPFIKCDLEGTLRSHQKDTLPVKIMYKNVVFLPLFYDYSPFLLSINFLLPKQTHTAHLEASVFCILFPVLYCSCILHFSQPTSCFFHCIIQAHVDQFSSLVFLFTSVLEEQCIYYKCIHVTLFRKAGLNIIINVRKAAIFIIITCLLRFLSIAGSFHGCMAKQFAIARVYSTPLLSS